jgi:hypothetical protein
MSVKETEARKFDRHDLPELVPTCGLHTVCGILSLEVSAEVEGPKLGMDFPRQ